MHVHASGQSSPSLLLNTADQLRTAPRVLGSERYRTDLAEVRACGSAEP